MLGESIETSESLNFNDVIPITINIIDPNKIFLFNGAPSCTIVFDSSLCFEISGGVGLNPLFKALLSSSAHPFAFILKYKITSKGIAPQSTVINLSTT